MTVRIEEATIRTAWKASIGGYASRVHGKDAEGMAA